MVKSLLVAIDVDRKWLQHNPSWWTEVTSPQIQDGEWHHTFRMVAICNPQHPSKSSTLTTDRNSQRPHYIHCIAMKPGSIVSSILQSIFRLTNQTCGDTSQLKAMSNTSLTILQPRGWNKIVQQSTQTQCNTRSECNSRCNPTEGHIGQKRCSFFRTSFLWNKRRHVIG